LVVCYRQKGPNAVRSSTPGTDHDNRVGCLQHGVGSSTRRAPDRREVILNRNLSPHKLPQTTSGFSSTSVFCQAQQGDYCALDNVTAVTYINKLGGTHSQALCQLALMIWDWCIQRDVFLVAEHQPRKDNITTDHKSRSTKDRCAEPPSLPADTTADGSSTDSPVCIAINKATAKFLQLETRSRSDCNRCRTGRRREGLPTLRGA